MVVRIAQGPIDLAAEGTLSLERLAKVGGDCLLALGPVLGLQHCRLLGQLKAAPPGLSGMVVAIEGGSPTILVGVLSNPEGRTAIARAVFEMGQGELPDPRDEADAVGELANVIAGRVKVALGRLSCRLSVPSAWAVDTAQAGERAALRVSFGSVPAALVIGPR